MANNNSRTLTANFVADTGGFSSKINDLIQRLKTLNQDFEQNKAKVKYRFWFSEARASGRAARSENGTDLHAEYERDDPTGR